MPRLNDLDQMVGDPVSWSGARPPEARVFTGRWIERQPLSAVEHARPMLERLSPHRELWTYQGDEAPADAEAAARGITALAEKVDRAFAIVDRAGGWFQGRVTLLRGQPAVGTIEVGAIIYAPSLQRTRAATEVQYLLMRYVFEDLGYRRYEWKCDSLNQPSRVAAARLGFVEEGTWRNAVVVKGRNRDTTWFSITDSEWPLVREALDAWLADDNFDESGHQRHSLAELRARLGKPTS
ncbi:GNAT family N-acetyltransferase [Frankia sp. CNm7]|uniref:GNAT family N-acetyltransferase n=1 Tax=Frankia nepalensis TaxID=1836974 RepID=A0A937UNJ5_9ACTN|nr:GNAT family protein [Frankia nepalensis]MBL7495794.1 GNAT family N-acetyltransferase [Frankia nepalensis]MBL7513272.1 GNAT family N-acetyltransferase [Frankia nepalensis]MBL7523776.1 GNAT family N-acetyltransferase [Frankia nepalensis]MBL7628153.1 GNAT family N-acetyltransferase [Frankia nepalensis]